MAEQTAFDMERVINDMVSSDDRDPPWLALSHEQPELFIQALFKRFEESQSTGIETRVQTYYNFYHDMVRRHGESDRVAFCSYRSGAALNISYRELHERCSRLVAEWSALGVAPGAAICIALPFGEDYLTALLTALRMGAIVTLVPDPVTDLARHRILVAAAAVVAEAADVAALFEDLTILPPRSSRSPHREELAHAYDAEAPCLRLFSVFAADPDVLAEVPAHAAYTGAVRDGLLAFGLRDGDRLAAPGFDSMQYQPQLLLMSLLWGVTYVHLPLQILADSPQAREQAAPTVLGVSSGLRGSPELLTDALTGDIRLWFRSMTERLDLHRWEKVESRFEGLSIRSLAIASNAAFGGAFAFSKRRIKQLALALFPAPGEPWLLEEVNQGGLAALGTAGILSHPGDPERLAVGKYVFSRMRDRYSIAASIDLSRDGRLVPVALYEAFICEVDDVERAALVLASKGEPNNASLLLLCFVDPLRGEQPTLQDAIVARCHKAFGPDLLPDRLAIYTIRPKLGDDGVLDKRWCSDQYLSGTLSRKQQHPIFVTLSQLGKVVQLLKEA